MVLLLIVKDSINCAFNGDGEIDKLLFYCEHVSNYGYSDEDKSTTILDLLHGSNLQF